MAIQNPAELAGKQKKIRILIAGYPGIGKTTLGLSAPKPLLIDADRGLDRVEAQYRAPFIQPKTYDELMTDLQPDNIKDFETLVIDTGGQLISLLSAHVIKANPKNGQHDGSLSLKGYGAVGREFERFTNHCYYELNKHVVILFHAKEEKDGDNTRLRLKVEGQTKDNVWQPMDLGGYMEMYGNDRTIGFSNCERYYAKGTHGISGVHKIPNLADGAPNDFLTRLFDGVNATILKESELYADELNAYREAVTACTAIIDDVVDAETATSAVERITGIKHALTSQTEARAAFKSKITSLGLVYDQEARAYKCAG